MGLRVRAVRGHRPYKRRDGTDEPDGHEPAVAGLFRASGIGFALKLLDFGHERAVRLDVNARALRELLEFLARQRGELLAEFVTVTRKRLVDVLNQKKVPLACALTSADAVNGMRVV